MTRIIGALLIAMLIPVAASAQQRTIYGPDGRVSGRVTTDSQGSTVIYGADGKVTGRTSTDSSGTVTIYGADGRRTGTVTPDRSKPKP